MKAMGIEVTAPDGVVITAKQIVAFVVFTQIATFEAALVVLQKTLTTRTLPSSEIEESVRRLALGFQQEARRFLQAEVTISEG